MLGRPFSQSAPGSRKLSSPIHSPAASRSATRSPYAAKEAFKQAADEKCFPEQLTTLGLKPWAARKLYALTSRAKGVPVLLDQSIYINALADSPKDFTEPRRESWPTTRPSPTAGHSCSVAHRLGRCGKAHFYHGGYRSRSGRLRARPESAIERDPASVEEHKNAAQSRRRLEVMASINDPEIAGADKLVGVLGAEVKKMPDDVAARTTYAVATRLARDGKWAEAREVYALLAAQYPGHPLAIEAFHWLTRYHASSEARRRTEIQQKLLITSVGFESLPGAEKVIATGGTSAQATAPRVREDQYRIYSPEAIVQWHQTCLDLEPRMIAFGPAYSRDPSAWLCFLAARRQVGRHNDAITFVRDYFKNTPGAASLQPGVDPWRDCLAAELWMTDRNLMPVQPKPLGVCRLTEVRPLLDGKLDDACWREVKPLQLGVASSAADNPDEVKAFGDSFKTEARFAYDEHFLYIAVSCNHPSGMKIEPVAKRTRDADLSGRDRVDILLDLDRDYQTYYRFQVDHRGCLAEDCWGDKGWNPKYFVAFHSTETGWTAEIAIPIQELTGDRPSHGKTWAANVSRVVPGRGVQTWSGPADDTPRPEGMGLLQFLAEK